MLSHPWLTHSLMRFAVYQVSVTSLASSGGYQVKLPPISKASLVKTTEDLDLYSFMSSHKLPFQRPTWGCLRFTRWDRSRNQIQIGKAHVGCHCKPQMVLPHRVKQSIRRDKLGILFPQWNVGIGEILTSIFLVLPEHCQTAKSCWWTSNYMHLWQIPIMCLLDHGLSASNSSTKARDAGVVCSSGDG